MSDTISAILLVVGGIGFGYGLGIAHMRAELSRLLAKTEDLLTDVMVKELIKVHRRTPDLFQQREE